MPDPGPDIVILGAGGHAKVAAEICALTGRAVRGFIAGASPDGPGPLLGGDELLTDPAFVASALFVIGIGTPGIREKLVVRLASCGARLATLVHPAAVISGSVHPGEGTLVNAGAVINVDTAIGARCVINTRAAVDHDCVLEDDVQVGPGAVLAGGVHCERGAYIGTGACVAPGVRLGAGCQVAAGTAVYRDIPPGARVAGAKLRVLD